MLNIYYSVSEMSQITHFFGAGVKVLTNIMSLCIICTVFGLMDSFRVTSYNKKVYCQYVLKFQNCFFTNYKRSGSDKNYIYSLQVKSVAKWVSAALEKHSPTM